MAAAQRNLHGSPFQGSCSCNPDLADSSTPADNGRLIDTTESTVGRRPSLILAITGCLLLTGCGDDTPGQEARPTENVGTGSSDPAPLDSDAVDGS